jgi:hypothetical protein
MSSEVLLAGVPDAWHEALTLALGDDAAKMKLTGSGEELKSALVDPNCKVVVIGDHLTGLSGFDALHASGRTAQTTSEGGGPIALLLADIRQDLELIELLQKRGVNGFVHRDTPIDELVARIRSCLYLDSRLARRHLIKANGSIEINGKKVKAFVEDVSSGGALVVGAARKLQGIAVGQTITLQARVGDTSLKIPFIVRRIERRKGLLSDQLAFGGSFVEINAEQEQALASILKWAAEREQWNELLLQSLGGTKISRGSSPF